MNDLALIYVFAICFLIFCVLVLNMYITFARERLQKRNEYLDKYGDIIQKINFHEKEKMGKHYKIEDKKLDAEYVEVIDVETGEIIKYYYHK